MSWSEPPDRLSRSRLWQLQRRFFEQRGVSAWSDGTVPHWVTSNPYIARRYAELVLAFLTDTRPMIDPARPVYIVELGAGAGRLGFHFLQAFEAMVAASPLRELRVCYVLTDLADANVAAWRAHPQLAAWRADGRLDLARFDVEHDAVIALDSGAVLAAGAQPNPLCVLANYVFDGIPIDAFAVTDDGGGNGNGNGDDGDGHGLAELAVSLHLPAPPDDPAILPRAELTTAARPLTAPYYADPILDAVLDEHRALPVGAQFTFPITTLHSLDRLATLAPRVLVVSTDKGEPTLHAQPALDITNHGSFSIGVNYHAIARTVARRGGVALLPSRPPMSVATCAFALGAPLALDATRAAYAALDAASPDAFFTHKQATAARYASLSIADLLAFLRDAEHDAKLAGECAPFLAERAADAGPAERAAILDELRACWAHAFPIGEPFDLAFALALVAAALAAWPDAITWFTASLHSHGPDTGTLFNLAACHHALGADADAARCLDALLALDPVHTPARALRDAIAATSSSTARSRPAPDG